MRHNESHLEALYSAALAADRAYSDALRAAYGGRASEIRYLPREQSPEVRALGDAFRNATETWLTSFREANARKAN